MLSQTKHRITAHKDEYRPPRQSLATGPASSQGKHCCTQLKVFALLAPIISCRLSSHRSNMALIDLTSVRSTASRASLACISPQKVPKMQQPRIKELPLHTLIPPFTLIDLLRHDSNGSCYPYLLPSIFGFYSIQRKALCMPGNRFSSITSMSAAPRSLPANLICDILLGFGSDITLFMADE